MKNTIEKKQEIWEYCRSKQWTIIPGPQNCLHFRDSKGLLVRLDFTDQNNLVMSGKVKAKDNNGKLFKWEELERGKYSEIKIEDNGLNFHPKKTKKVTKPTNKKER